MANQKTYRDEEAAYAGQVLYNSFNNSSVSTASVHSNQHIPTYSVSAAVLEDPDVHKCCRMSAIRRTFCLLVTFDLILCFILWVINSQVEGVSLDQALKIEVVNYDFQESMFDIVWMSWLRFFILISSYALFRIRKPWMVAVSTFITCVFLLCKIFLYDWGHNHNGHITPMPLSTTMPPPSGNDPFMKYLLIIASFVISWVEVWLLDFRVLPLEQKARERAATLHESYHERTPLLHGNRPALHDFQSDNFYSPYESRQGSDDEEGDFRSIPGSRGHSRNGSRTINALNEQEKQYVKMAKEGLEVAWKLICSTDEWKIETGNDKRTGIITSKNVQKLGKVFRLQGLIECPAKIIFEDLVFNYEESTHWNPTVVDIKILQVIDETTDIAYSVAAEGIGGLVSSRDFVNVRHWKMRDGLYVSAGVSAEHPDKPPCKQHVRGHNGASAWVIKPLKDDPNTCEFTWVLNVHLKGWLPQSLIDQALGNVMKEFLKALQNHAKQLHLAANGNAKTL